MDAYLAAFAQAGDYQLVTTDAAFAQFDGLDLELLGSPSGQEPASALTCCQGPALRPRG
jgi:hypothetical protein